jgi:hypothetical protein
MEVLDDHNLTSDAIEQTYQRLTRGDGEHEAELAAVQHKLAETAQHGSLATRRCEPVDRNMELGSVRTFSSSAGSRWLTTY